MNRNACGRDMVLKCNIFQLCLSCKGEGGGGGGGGGGLSLKTSKFEHIFIAVIISPPFFCVDIFDTNLLFIVCALR